MIRNYPFVTVDVFTATRFGGNPLAVVLDAAGLSDAEMRSIAREFNLSETSFVLPPENPAHTARVRIFTPEHELPFAGHPNVGTGYVLAQEGRARGDQLVFEELAGLVPIALRRDAAGMPLTAAVEAPRPLTRGRLVPTALIARCCGLTEADVAPGFTPQVAGVGAFFTFAELVSLGALARASPDIGACRAAAAEDRALGMQTLFVREPQNPNALRMRMFAPAAGVLEDPATGAAAAALAAHLLAVSGGSEAAYTIRQGLEMGRPSEIHARAWRPSPGAYRASISGQCVPVQRGTITV